MAWPRILYSQNNSEAKINTMRTRIWDTCKKGNHLMKRIKCQKVHSPKDNVVHSVA